MPDPGFDKRDEGFIEGQEGLSSFLEKGIRVGRKGKLSSVIIARMFNRQNQAQHKTRSTTCGGFQ